MSLNLATLWHKAHPNLQSVLHLTLYLDVIKSIPLFGKEGGEMLAIMISVPLSREGGESLTWACHFQQQRWIFKNI